MIEYDYGPLFGQSNFKFIPQLKEDRNSKANLKGGSKKRSSRKYDGKTSEF